MLSQVSGETTPGERVLEPAAHETASAATAAEPATDAFEAPVESDAAPVTHTAASGPNPYDYDREGYSYLRGIVDFNDDDKTWHIIYNLKPTRDDKFSGAIQLLPDPALRSLRPGQVVYVEGGVDYKNVDGRGKPQYRVDHLQLQKPNEK